MTGVEPIDPASVVYRGRDFTKAEAEALTSSIRAYAKVTCFKLADAHQGRAYLAMGYDSFEEYCATELDISRSRGYQLLRHAATMRELADAAGIDPVSTNVHTAEGQTRSLDTTAVAATVAERVAAEPDADDNRRAEIVDEVVEEYKRTTKTSTTVDTETGEKLNESPTDAPSDDPGDASPSGSPGHLAPVPSTPAPSFASVGDLIDWCPEDGQWLTYAEMQRTEATKHFAGVMNKRIPRDADQDIAGLCPPEALRSAIFAAEVARTYWADLVDDLKKRQDTTTDGRHLAAVEG